MFGLEMRELLIAGGGGVLGLAVLLLLMKAVFGRGKRKTIKNKGTSQRESVDEYPDPPPAKPGRRLLVDGLEVRLRLVVVAPAGTQSSEIPVDNVDEMLDDFMRGLSNFLRSDLPRVRSWPPQLSAKGFAPTFFRLVESPDPEGTKSHWIRLAGPVRAAGELFLLGLALWSEDASKIGAIDLGPNQWAEHLKIERS
jgi:hypothetical protein